jgi:hypothetical protein
LNLNNDSARIDLLEINFKNMSENGEGNNGKGISVDIGYKSVFDKGGKEVKRTIDIEEVKQIAVDQWGEGILSGDKDGDELKFNEKITNDLGNKVDGQGEEYREYEVHETPPEQQGGGVIHVDFKKGKRVE